MEKREIDSETTEDLKITGKRKEAEGVDSGEVVRKRARIPGLEGCRSIENFTHIEKIDEGSYGIVYKARDNQTGEMLAIKKVKLDKEKEGFPITSLREIISMLAFEHKNIVKVREVVYGSTLDKIYIVMDFVDYELKSLIENKKILITNSHVKTLIYQLLSAVEYMHDKWIVHRDLKTSNLLIDNKGVLKVCDFGLARKYGSPLRAYTHMVVTLWYRAPELLLGTRVYTPAIDIWSLGCIFAELLLREPLLTGINELDQLDKIFRLLGMPSESSWPGWRTLKHANAINFGGKNIKKYNMNRLGDKFPRAALPGDAFLTQVGVDLMNKMLSLNPDTRITAQDALKHKWFREPPYPQAFIVKSIIAKEPVRNKQK